MFLLDGCGSGMVLDVENVQSVEWIWGGNYGCSGNQIWCPYHAVNACTLISTASYSQTWQNTEIYVDESYVFDFLNIPEWILESFEG